MQVFQFRLQALLDRRMEEKQRAEEFLAARERELAIERNTMKSLEEDVQRTENLYRLKRTERFVSGVHSGVRLSNQSDFLVGLKLDVQAAHAGVLSQQVFVDQAMDAVQDARSALEVCRREVEVLEKYRDKAEKQFLQEIAYKEELEQDEIGNVMHLSRRART